MRSNGNKFDYNDFQSKINELDQTNLNIYSLSLIDPISSILNKETTYNLFYKKSKEFIEKELFIPANELDTSILFGIFLPFFKNPNKYRKSNTEFEFSVKDIHKQLFLIKKLNFYKKDHNVDQLLFQLNDAYGIPLYTKKDYELFVQSLKAI
jgi:hypothetical protein